MIAGDGEIDRRYLDIERQVVDLLGRHAPVASDLRLLTAILRINLHLERIGDMAVNVAWLGQVVADAPRSRRWTGHLEQMSEHAVWMVELAMPADRLPIVGPLPWLEALYLVVSHSGVTLAPVLGRLVAAEVAEQTADGLLATFRPSRFAERATRVMLEVESVFREPIRQHGPT